MVLTSESRRLLGYADDVAVAPLETGGVYLARLLEHLAAVRAGELDHGAIARAVAEVVGGAVLDQHAEIWSTDLYDQSEDVARYVAPDLAIRTLYTLLHRAAAAEPALLTHTWIVETTASAVQNYRASDAVKARRGAFSGAG